MLSLGRTVLHSVGKLTTATKRQIVSNTLFGKEPLVNRWEMVNADSIDQRSMVHLVTLQLEFDHNTTYVGFYDR